MTNKYCPSCDTTKDIAEFGLHKREKDGHRYCCKSCNNAQSRNYAKNNKEKVIEYRKNNSEHYRELYSSYRLKNREHINRKERERRLNNPSYRLRKNIRALVWKYLKISNTVKTKNTEDLIGVSMDQIKKELESKFKPGMTWDNYGKWHIDHIKPQCLFDFTNEEDIKKCWSLDNLQPLWAEENLKKGNKQSWGE